MKKKSNNKPHKYRKNILINGQFNISQREGKSPFKVNNFSYLTDKWTSYLNGKIEVSGKQLTNCDRDIIELNNFGGNKFASGLLLKCEQPSKLDTVDLFGMAQALIADPALVKKSLNSQESKIIPCLAHLKVGSCHRCRYLKQKDLTFDCITPSSWHRENLESDNYSKKKEVLPTGTCLILITPDSERTMCTFLGTAGKINENDVNVDYVKKSQIVFC